MKNSIRYLTHLTAVCLALLALLAPAWSSHAGGPPSSPSITTEPTNLTAAAGSTVTFSVVATGPSLTYHWTFNGGAILNNQPFLTLTNIVDGQAGTYLVVVANSFGSVTSTPATLTVLDLPKIATQPESQVLNTGDEAYFMVDVSGTTPFGYQWKTNGVALTGETNFSLDLFPVQDSDAGTYSVVVTNAGGSATSANAYLTVVEPAIVGVPSIASALNACTNVTLSVLTYGTDTNLSYQWTFGTNVVGTDSPHLVLTDISLASAGVYRVSVSNSVGSYAIASGTLMVQYPPPVISGCPSNLTIGTGPGRATCDQVVSWTPPTASSTCPGVTISSPNHPGDIFPVGISTVTYIATDAIGQQTVTNFTVTVQDTTPPRVATLPKTLTLDNTGKASLAVTDVFDASLSSDNCGTVTPVSVTPNTFGFCDAGTVRTVTVIAVDASGNFGTNTAQVTINAPTVPPAVVYVDTNYSGSCAAVTFPFNGGTGTYYLGYNAFSTIQAGLNVVTNGGTILVAPGTYNENPVINQPVTLTSIGGNSASNTILVIQPADFPNEIGGITINASSVAVKGFTSVGLDATNNQNAPAFGSASVNIFLTDAYTNIEIANNIVEVGAIGQFYTGSDGFGFETTYPNFPTPPSNLGSWPPGTSPSVPLADNINLHNNIFKPVDVPPAYDTPGNAFYINPAGSFSFESNTITGDLANSTTEATNSLIAYNVIIGGSTNDASGGIATLGYPDPAVYGHAQIFNNVISNTPTAIFVYDSENVLIESNLLDGNGIGVAVLDSGYDPVYPAGTTVLIADNSLADDGAGLLNTSTNSTPVAVSNWWGSVSGPGSASLNYYGTGSGIAGALTFIPWLGNGTNAITNGFAPLTPVAVYPPAQLVFSTEPAGASLGAPLSVQPVVQLEDAYGQLTPWANPVVTNSLGHDLTGAILLGTTNEPAAGGVAIYTDLYVAVSGGSNLTLVASAPALPSVTSTSFNITNPVPVITSITPFFARAGGGNVALTVNGSNFVADSVVYWNGIALATVYVSSTELTATVPAADIATIASVPITVGSPGPGGGGTTSLSFSVDVAQPPVTYVDTNYASLPANTLVNWPYNGASGTHIVGYDAFATIQQGINGVATNGTVNVAAGNYAENLIINNPLSLLGPNATNNPNTGTRVAEAKIFPATSDPSPFDDTYVISVYASNVTFAGFTLDGDNPLLTSGIELRGADLDASEGIGNFPTVGSITVMNNIVKDFTVAGIDFENTGDPTSGNTIQSNKIINIGFPATDYTNYPYGYGIGILIYNNFYAEISGNVITDNRVGIQTGNFYLPNSGSEPSISGNFITSTRRGIFHNLAYESASTFTISNNVVSAESDTNVVRWDGITLSSIQQTVGANVINNTVTGGSVAQPTAGYQVWNDPTTTGVNISGGTVSNASYGVWINNYEGYGPSAGSSCLVTVSNVNISQASVAGIYVQDDPRASANGVLLRTTVNGNTVITNSALGVWVQGTNAGASLLNNGASITGNAIGVAVDTGVALLQGNDLTGNTLAGISATNGAIVDAGNCTGQNVTGLGISTGGNNLSGYGFDHAAPFAIINANSNGIPVVLAEHDAFGALAGTNIVLDFSGAVEYSQTPAILTAPTNLFLVCASDVPAGATSLASFTAQGGYYSGSTAAVSFSDDTHFTGSGVIHRTYTVTDGCSVTNIAVQTITVSDTVPPVFTLVPSNTIYSADQGLCLKANVTWTLGVTDNCSVASIVSTPASGSTFPKGTTVVTNVATDYSGNMTVATFTVTVIDTQPPVVTFWPATNMTLDVNGQCEALVPNLIPQIVATDNCDTPVYTQIPPANTLVSLGHTNVLLIVSDLSSNSVSNFVTLNVVDSNSAPLLTYVDANYAGLPPGTVVTFPYGGSGGSHYVGCDAYATIQAGVNRVATNGTVNVAAGRYVEEVTINNPVSLIGPNATNNPNTGTRVAEAVIQPDTSDPEIYDSTAVVLVSIASSNVTVKGFTIDGYNPYLTGTVYSPGYFAYIPTQSEFLGVYYTSATNTFNAANGIADLNGDSSIRIENNILRNDAYAGVDLESDGPGSPPNTDSHIVNNLFENIDYNTEGFGTGISLYNNYYAEITGNTFSNVTIGISPQNFYLPNPGEIASQTISSNTVSSSLLGIWLNLVYESASTFVISDNTSVFSPTNGAALYGPAEWDGIEITSIQSATSVVLSNNLVTGPTSPAGYNTVGYNLWNTPSTGTVLITGGTVSNTTYGVWINNYDGYQSPGSSTLATVQGVEITGSTAAGIYVQDDPRASTNGVLVQATVNGNTVITKSALGVWVQGTNAGASLLNNGASITGNAIGVAVDTGVALLQGNDLTGNTLAGISATNGAIVDAGNCTGQNVTGLGISTGGNNLSGYGFDHAAPFAIINANSNGIPVVLAEHDAFGALAGTDISTAFSGPANSVTYSQNPLLVTAPANVSVECVNQLTPAATDLSSFLALGGRVTANSVMVTSQDAPAIAPQVTTLRTYTISDGCSSTNVQQSIAIFETNAPVIGNCPANFVSPGPVVTYTLPSATDLCGSNAVYVTGYPASGSTLPPGVNTIVCVASNNAGLTNFCTFEVVVPNLALTNVFVDAAYSGLPPGTSVTWPNTGGTGSHNIGLDAFASLQSAVNAVTNGGTVYVAAGSYGSLAAGKPVTLLGANQGVGGCAARGAESIINGGSGIAVDIQSDGVTLDGFALQGAIGLRDLGHQSLLAQNNAITAAAFGVELEGIAPTAINGVTVQSNCVTLTSQLANASPTAGFVVAEVAGTVSPVIMGNNVSGAYEGYLLYGLDAAQPTVIQGGDISGVMQGVFVLNLNPVTLASYLPSSFAVEGVTMSAFAGNYSNVPALANTDFHAGIYVYTGGTNGADAITGVISNVTISGTGKISPDSSGLYFADFSAVSNVMQTITVQNCTVENNLNRGIFATGSHAVVNVTQSSILNNGGDPYGLNGNYGFGIIARNQSQLTVTQSFIANPAVQTNYEVFAMTADANTNPQGPTLTVSDCSIINNGNGGLAHQSAGTLNASANWWGTVSATAIAGLNSGVVDFTPYLASGTDTDANTPGFQGDFSLLDVVTNDAQTGVTGRIQEAVNLVTTGGTVNVAAGIYPEYVTIAKSLSLDGPNFGIDPNTGARTNEAVIQELGNSWDSDILLTIENVTNLVVNGLTFEGNNNLAIPGQVNAEEAIYLQDSTNVNIGYNIMQDFGGAGVDAEGVNGISDGISIHHNSASNISGTDIYQGVAFLLYNGAYGTIATNNVNGVQIGVQMDTELNGMTNAVSVLGNQINSTIVGIFLNNSFQTNTGNVLVQGNNIVATNSQAFAGLVVWSIWINPGSFELLSNTISGNFEDGIEAWNNSMNVTVSGGTIAASNMLAGVYEDTVDAYGPVYTGGQGVLTLQGLAISGAPVGIWINDNGNGGSYPFLKASVQGGSITGIPGTIGVKVTGALAKAIVNGASITNNAIGVSVDTGVALVQNNHLAGNTLAGIVATNGAIVDAGDCTGTDATGLGSSAGGNILTGYLAGPAKAVVNSNPSGIPAVLAYGDSFGATALQPEITSALAGSVLASQSGGLLALAPPTVTVQCYGLVPAPYASLSAFETNGGVASTTTATVASADSALVPGPYEGNVTRTYTLTDACGQIITAQQTITVHDTTAPTITQCAGNLTINAAANGYAAMPDMTSGVLASDNCGVSAILQSPAVGTPVFIGTNQVTFTAVDTSSNVSAPCYASIIVKDVTPPNITCPPNVTINLLQSKDPYATGMATGTDVAGPVTISYTDNGSGLTNCNSTGVLLRTWVGTAPTGNTNFCTQTITVTDTNAPFFTFIPATITTNNDASLCSAVVSYPTPTSEVLGYFEGFEDTNFVSDTNSQFWGWNDYASHVSRVASGTGGITAESGSAFGLIDSTVAAAGPDYAGSGAYTLMGGGNAPFGNGFYTSLDVYVNLADPAITGATPTNGYGWDLDTASQAYNGSLGGYGRDYIFHTAAYGAGGVVVAADNNSSDTGTERRNDLLSVSNHAVLTNSGWYKFEWLFRNNTNNALAVDLNVRDASGNVVFSQTLSDPDDVITNISGNPNYMWFNFLAVDTLAIDNTVFERNVPILASQASDTPFIVATNTVVLTATDACGNTANTNFTVIVNDTQPPVISGLSNVTQNNDAGACGAVVTFVLPTNSITDNCGVALITATPPSGSTFPVGTSLVTVVATDIHGNSSTNSFDVIVNDTQPPTFPALVDVTQANDSNECSAYVTFSLPTNAITDNCGIAGIVAIPPSGTIFPVGTNPVAVVATDIHGNSATNSFNVIVNDTQRPVIAALSNLVQAVDPGQTYATVTFSPYATDNCAISNVIANPPSGTHFPTGTNPVTVVATDIHGNTAQVSFTVLVVGLPQITQQPASRTNNAGTTASFSVAAASPTPLGYQWLKNGASLTDGGNITGSSTATLSVTAVSDSDVAGYSVVVSNLAGTVTSSNAYLTVIDPPVIAGQPTGLTNNATTTASFTVSVTGTSPFGYQWYKNGTNLLIDGGNVSGSRSNTLTLSNVLAADRGLYSVIVSNPAAVLSSSNALLAVNDPWISSQPVSAVQPLSGTVAFSVTGVGTAPLTYVWEQNGIPIPSATNSSYNIGTIRDSDSGGYLVIVSSAGGSVTSSVATLTVTHPPVFVTQPSSVTVNVGQNATFNVSMNGTAPFSYQWQKNLVNIGGATNHALSLTSVTTNDAGNYDVVVTNADGVATSRTAVLTVIVLPSIVAQPLNLTTNAGSTTSFTVVAAGTSLQYQWFKNATNILRDGVNISGSTNATLTLTNVLGANDGAYSVLITNVGGSLLSSNAVLTVIDPIITNEPASQQILLGTPVTFAVGAYGTTPVYQWRKNGTPIGSATNSTFTLASVANSDGAAYDVVVSTAYGSVTSAPPALLTVLDPPVIGTEPSSRTNNAGTTATFTVSAAGTPPLSYQWLKNGVALADSSHVNGSATSTLTLFAVTDADIAGYTVVVTNLVGTNTSTSASLFVVDAPVITLQPVSVTNNAGTTATFSVTATGTPPLIYQWYKDVTNVLTDTGEISGSASNLLTLTNVLGANRGEYSVVVSNAAGKATSTNALLTVIDPVITLQPTNTKAIDSSTVTFTVAAVGTSPLTYRWQVDGEDLQDGFGIGGSGTPTLSITNVTDSDAGTYSVVVSNAEGVATSVDAILTTVPSLIVFQPQQEYVVIGNPFSFSVGVNGTLPFSYQWLFDSNNIAGATNRIYSQTNATLANDGYYQVIVTNPDGSETSYPVRLEVYSNPVPLLTITETGYPHFAVTLTGVPTFNYSLQATTNFVNWTTLTTNTSPFTYIETNGYPQRFYRGLYLP